MKYFSVPADFRLETIDAYAELNQQYLDAKVLETYGQITIGNFMESGRSLNLLPEVDLLDLERFIAYSKERNIGFNYTINGTHMGNREFTTEGVQKIKNFLGQLYKVGVRSLTVALPSVIEIVKSSGYDFKIKSSTLCQIINANKAASYKKMGVERIVVDESINRDFLTLQQINKVFPGKVEVIVNVVCHKNCIYRMFHYNQMANDSVKKTNDVSVNYYSHRCMMKRCEEISNIMRLNWIRPEDLKFYTAIGVEHFKIQGRQAVLKGDPVKVVKAYFDESYQGNLMKLLDVFSPTNSFIVNVDNQKLDGFIKPFVDNPHFCKNACGECGYCDRFAQSCIDYTDAESVVTAANNFYQEVDQFNELINSIAEEDSCVCEESLDIEFNF